MLQNINFLSPGAIASPLHSVNDKSFAAGAFYVMNTELKEKFCTRCKKTKPVSEFHKRTLKTGFLSYQSNCAMCVSELIIAKTAERNKDKKVVDLEGEIWINVDGYDRYLISNFIRIKSLPEPLRKYEALLSPIKNSTGYYMICLYKNGVSHPTGLHRIIAQAFIPNPENKPCVNHINNNPSDNRIENLEWCTYKENTQHAVKQGRMYGHTAKLSKKQVLEIFNSTMQQRPLAKLYNVNQGTVASIKSGKNWGHLTGKTHIKKYSKKVKL